MEFRTRVVDSYDELFGKQSGLGLDRVSSFSGKWGWYQSLYGLAQGDITRFQHITKLGVHECLMMLSFMKDKNELEAEQIKRKIK